MAESNVIHTPYGDILKTNFRPGMLVSDMMQYILPGNTVMVEGIESVIVNGVPIPTSQIQYVEGIQSVVQPGKITVPVSTYVSKVSGVAMEAETKAQQEQVKYWETQIKQAEDVLRQGDIDAEHPLDRAQVQKDIESYQAKAELVKQHIAYGVGMSPQISILTSPQAQAFVNLSKDGAYTVDVEGIIRSGMDPMQVKQLGITDEAISQVKALNKLITYKTAGGGYNVVKAVQDGKGTLLLDAGFKQKDIDFAKKFIEEQKKEQKKAELIIQTSKIKGGHEEILDLEDYRSSGGYDIVKYMIDNPGTGESALLAYGFSQEDIDIAKQYASQPFAQKTELEKIYEEAKRAGVPNPEQIIQGKGWVRPTGGLKESEYADLIKEYALKYGEAREQDLSERTTAKSDMSLTAFRAEFLNARGIDKNHPDYKAYVSFADTQYAKLYGQGTTMASVGTEALAVAFPAARALHPEVQFRDIGGTEWAMTGVSAALLVLAPAAGAIGGTVGKVASTVLTDVALGTWGTVYGLEYSSMTPAERVINAVLLLGFAGAVLGKPITNTIRRITKDVKLSDLTTKAGNALRSSKSDAIYKAADELEAYGKAMKVEGRAGADAIIAEAQSLRYSADTGVRFSFKRIGQNTIAEIKAYSEQLKDLANRIKYDERGSIELKTARELREQAGITEKRIEVTETPRWLADEWETLRSMGLSSDEIYELLKLSGGNEKLFKDLLSARVRYRAQQKSLKRAIDETKKEKMMEARREISGEGTFEQPESWQPTREEIEASWEQHIKETTKPEPALPSKGYALLFSSRNKELAGRTGELLARDYSTQSQELTFIKIDRDGKTTTWTLTVPALINGVATILESETKTELSNQQKTELERITRQITKTITEQKNDTGIGMIIDTAVETKTEGATETKTETKLAPFTKTDLKQAFKTVFAQQTILETPTTTKITTMPDTTIKPPTPRPVPPTPVPPEPGPPEPVPPDEPPPKKPIKIILPGGGTGSKEKPAKPRKGAVAWAQGIGWWTRWKPYGKKEMQFTLEKPNDAAIVPDSKSAYDTIQTISGLPPDKIPKMDMGIMDVHITKPPRTPRRSNRASIRFKPDPHVVNNPHRPPAIKSKRVGQYYVAGNMVSRHPIGRRKRS